jgi:predicted ribosomally synthesized peptide with nif11-like leader
MTPAKNPDVVRLIERFQKDEAFRDSFVEATDHAIISAQLKEAGFEFTAQEFQDTLTILKEENTAELSDTEMDTVVGGANILSQLKDEVTRDYDRCQVTGNKVVNHAIWSATMPFRFMAGNIS